MAHRIFRPLGMTRSTTLIGPLEHGHYDTFRAAWRRIAGTKEFFRFEIGTDGKVAALHAEIAGSVEFRRR